jgi:starvation-inducible DNA-binding protein
MAATTKKSNVMPRPMLSAEAQQTVSAALQACLTDMIDLALLLKQAHWNIVGSSFRSIHLQLDEIIDDTREGVDEIAERMSQIGVAPDGRSRTVSSDTRLANYPEGFVNDDTTVTQASDAMATTIEGLRAARGQVADPDPITEDMLIDIIGTLEKHLWMMQSREAKA